MNRLRVVVVLLCTLLLAVGEVRAQQTDTTVVPGQSGYRDEVPEVLKKLARQYRQQVETDSIQKENGTSLVEGTLLNNLVMDNTLSNIGRDFYAYFYENWDPPQTDQHFTLYINEKPSPGIGNMVMIRINYERIFTGRLVPRQETLEALADQAIARAVSYIANYEQIRQQLEGEDMQGTGIY